MIRACLLLSGLCGVAACFSVVTPSPDRTTVDCARAEEAPGPDTAFVVIRGFAFHPAQLTVPSGTVVVWVNCEGSDTPGHTTTGTAWDSPTLRPEESFGYRPTPGSYDYHCRPHPFMEGRVVVTVAQLDTKARR